MGTVLVVIVMNRPVAHHGRHVRVSVVVETEVITEWKATAMVEGLRLECWRKGRWSICKFELFFGAFFTLQPTCRYQERFPDLGNNQCYRKHFRGSFYLWSTKLPFHLHTAPWETWYSQCESEYAFPNLWKGKIHAVMWLYMKWNKLSITIMHLAQTSFKETWTSNDRGLCSKQCPLGWVCPKWVWHSWK